MVGERYLEYHRMLFQARNDPAAHASSKQAASKKSSSSSSASAQKKDGHASSSSHSHYEHDKGTVTASGKIHALRTRLLPANLVVKRILEILKMMLQGGNFMQ